MRIRQRIQLRNSFISSTKVDHLVKPVKASLNNVSRAVKNKADSVSRWSGDLTDSFRSKDKVRLDIECTISIAKSSFFWSSC